MNTQPRGIETALLQGVPFQQRCPGVVDSPPAIDRKRQLVTDGTVFG